MPEFIQQARLFGKTREDAVVRARASAAFFLALGIDLDAAVAAPAEHRIALGKRLQRLIERERLRGAARHWSYDLNRHIALKQALVTIGAGIDPGGTPIKRNGARKRRLKVR